MIKLGILGSTRGTHLLSLQAAIADQQLEATVAMVISNKPDALILAKSEALGIPHAFIDPQGKTREQYDDEVSYRFKQAQVELIVLIGYMRILSKPFTQAWNNKIINVHPSLLPAFAGLMDLQVHQAVLAAKVQETGCTVHYVTEVVDAGPILWQERCAVLLHDTPETLKERVQALEAKALVKAIQQWSNSI